MGTGADGGQLNAFNDNRKQRDIVKFASFLF